jgi:hypothetical protein
VRVRAITPAALAEMSSALVDGEFWADLTSARLDRDDVLLEIGSERGSQNLLKIGCASAPQTNPAGPRDRIVLLSYSEANGSVELRCVDGSCLVPVTRLWVECVTA